MVCIVQIQKQRSEEGNDLLKITQQLSTRDRPSIPVPGPSPVPVPARSHCCLDQYNKGGILAPGTMNKNANDNPVQAPHSSKVLSCLKFPEYSHEAGAREEPACS